MELFSDADLGIQSAPAPTSPSSSQQGADSLPAYAPGGPPIAFRTGPLPDYNNARPPAGSDVPSADSTNSAPKLFSDEDLGIGADTPHTAGVLSNAPDDGYLSGALKGLGTAAIKGASDAAGFVGGLGSLTDYLMARAEAKITGQPVEAVLADLAKAKQDQQQHALSLGLPSWTDPRNVLPGPDTISAPVLKQTGEYVPTTEPGRLAQAGAEAAFSSLGPGLGGASNAATASGRALAAGATRNWGAAQELLKGAPALMAGNAVAGTIGTGATDLTGDPLIGMGAGLAGAVGGQLGGAAARKVATPIVMGVPGIDRVPIVGAAVSSARDNTVAGQILKKSAAPDALREWAAQPAPAPDVPNSPQTLAGAVGDDRGLFQAEKDARNANNLPFNAIDQAQSDAQQAAITGMQPTGDVFRPGQMIRQRLDAIDQAAQQAKDRLAAAHQDAVTQRQMATQAFTDQQRSGLMDRQDARRQGTVSFADQQRADLADRTVARGQVSSDQKAAAEAARQAEHDRLVQVFHDAHDQSAQTAADQSQPLRELPPAEQIGAAYREAQQEATDAANKVRKAVYYAVDPDGTLTTVVTPLKDAKDAIRADIDPHVGVDPTGAEAKLWGDIDRMPDVVPFKSLQKLDGRVTAAMTDARRNPNPEDPEALYRLTRLKSATMDAIHDGVENQAAHEARLIESGAMPAEDAMEARMRSAWGVQNERSLNARSSVGRAETGTGGLAGGGASASVGGIRAGRSSEGRVGQASGDPRIPAPPLRPNFDQAAVDRLAAAKRVHADFTKTHENPTVDPILADNGFKGQYKLANGSIPERAVVPGGKGFETADAFLKAAGNDPRAIAAMQNASLALLRKHMPPIGNLHPRALATWKENYSGALRALDAVAPGFSGRFDTAASATQALLDIGVEQKQALTTFQREAARQAVLDNVARREELGQASQADRAQVRSLIDERTQTDRTAGQQDKAQISSLIAERNSDDRAAIAQSRAATAEGIAQARGVARDARATPAGQFVGQGGDRIASAEVENAVGSMLKTGTQGATRMRSLVATVAKEPDALAGLRKAGVDWIVRTFQKADGTVSGARMIDFIRDNRDVLKELYPTAQMSMFGAIARNIEENSRWMTETAIKAGSDSAKNIKPMLSDSVKTSAKHTSMMMIAAEAMREGFDRDGVRGATLAGGGAATLYMLNSLRSAGIKSVGDLYSLALSDPEKARFMISKMPETSEGGKLRALSGALRRDLIVGEKAVADHKPRQ